MTGDEMELEARIAEILDRLGLELQQAATRLRFAPLCTVEEFLIRAEAVFRGIKVVRELLNAGCVEKALRHTQFIDVPEIEFEGDQE
ncbi:MAG: hypothetical protein WBV94_06900 [Blastocatellia bacterium]